MSSPQEEILMSPRDQMTPEHAIDLTEINNVPDMEDYIKGVAAVVGANKIVNAYRKNGKIRIYLKNVSCVEEVIHTGVRVLGRQADIDYRIKSATKVLLSNVESEILNSTIENLLVSYGDICSRIDIMRLGLNDPEYSHIESNIRQVHMRLYPGATIPRSLEVFQNGKKYKINIKMEKTEGEHLVIGEQEGISEPAPVSTGTSSDQTANSVQGSTLASPRQAEDTVKSSMETSSTISSDQLQNTSQGLQHSPNFVNRCGQSRERPRVERNTVNHGSSYRQQISPSNPNVIKSKVSNIARRSLYRQLGNHALSNGQFESEALSTNVTSPNVTDVGNDFDSTGNDAKESNYIPLNFENPYNAFSEPGNSALTSSLQNNIPMIKVEKDSESYQTSLVEKEHNYSHHTELGEP